MSRITVDFDVYPLIQITLHDALEADGVHRMYGELEALLGRRGHYVTVVDTTALPGMPDAVARRALADGGAAIGEHAQRYSLGTAIIVGSSFVRSALTAFNWIRHDRFKLPEVYLPHRQQAYEWAAGQLDTKDAMTPEVRAFMRRGGASV